MNKISVLLWKINTKLEIYWVSRANSCGFCVFAQFSGNQYSIRPWILCIKYSGNPVNRGKFRLEHLNQFFPCRNCVETVSTKINTQHLWNLCGSSHSFYVSSVISYTKDCGEKFQKVQKLIKSFLINSYFQHKLTEKDPFITTETRQALLVLIMQMHN